VGKNCRYLYISFDGETDDEGLAAQYVEALKEFDSIETLRIEVMSDGNFSKICKIMNSDPNFPWFEKVTTIKIYEAKDMKDKNELCLLLTKFRNLVTMKGIS